VIRRIRALLKKNAPEKAPLDINETLQEVIALTAGELGKNQVSLRTELEADLPPVLGDRVELQQVLLNLILNGCEAMSESGWRPRELLISSRKCETDEVMVSVRDSGVGIDPQTAERLFDAFFTTKEGGLGLGLSISRRIIEAHGGRIWSTPNEDRGATLRFTLPTVCESRL
jgi:signal transduction histidine kinase